MDHPKCVICGGVNDSKTSWQSFCLNCGRETWGAGVVASFIQMALKSQDKVTECEAVIKELRNRIEELERPY